ncbi:MAG: response regulator, partial [Candidatus Sericytochromatia bacterium]
MKPRVLVLEDSLTVRMDLQEALEEAGFEVAASGTAEAFRRALAGATPALVILDRVLPDADGLAVLKDLKCDPETALVPVVLLATEAEVQEELRALATGADAYIGKPYDRAHLVDRARALAAGPAPAVAGPGATRVLVVEDSITYREELREALEAEGYAVTLAETGEEGLQRAATERPEAMIVDGGLPGISGVTVVRRVRLDPALRRVPCMFLTASEHREDELAALEAGADAYLRKGHDIPFIIARLGAMLRAAGGPEAIRLAPGEVARRVLLVGGLEAADPALAEALEAEGYRLAFAQDPAEALSLLAIEPVDAILLAGAGLGAEALAFCAEVKGCAAHRDLPLLVLEEGGTPQAMITALEAGADDFIGDTRDYEVITGRVRALLRRKHFEEENRRIQETLMRQEVELAEARAARELAETRAALAAENERLQREKIEALKEADRLKDQFLSILSHELRTPLNALVGFGSLLEDEAPGPLNAQQHAYVRKMLAGADVLLSLVNDLLDMSRIQAGKFSLEPEPMGLRGTVEEVLSTLAPLAE